MEQPENVMYLIQETTSGSLKALESANTKKNRGLRFESIFQKDLNKLNQNKRVYRKDLMENSIAQVMPKVHKRQFLNEQSHPITDDPRRFTTIALNNVSHLITDFDFKGDDLTGIGECLNTRIGLDMAAMIEQEIPVEFSLRALGSVKKNAAGLAEAQNVRVFCYDWVNNASHRGSEVQRIITESISEDQISEMILTESNKLQLLCESMENDEIELFNEDAHVSYNLAENTVMFCTDGSCMKVFLEEHIRTEFNSSFSKFSF